MATWDNLPLELKFQIAAYLIDDACQITKPHCQVQRPQPLVYYPHYPDYHPKQKVKHNVKHFEVQWTSRSAVISTGLYTIVQADPKMAAVVDHICQQRQIIPKQELRNLHATMQLVFEEPQPPWRLIPKFIWLLKAENLMREIAILHHLGIVGRVELEPEEPGEITEDSYKFSIC